MIGPAEPVLAALGDDAELPCRLSPSVSAERMELRWFRGKVAAAVLVRRDGREREAEQTAEYRGRATLLDGDIAAGRVAVRIHRVRASDDCEYRCLFRQDGRYGEASVHLKVAGECAGSTLSGDFRAASVFPAAPLLWKPPRSSSREIPSRAEKAGGPRVGGKWEGVGEMAPCCDCEATPHPL